jgi:curved DNA-binding protein CbpA
MFKNHQDIDNIDEEELFKQMKQKKSHKTENIDKGDKSDNSDNSDKDLTKIKKFGFDYYKILGLDKTASKSEIAKRYRHLLAKYHPDKFKNLSDKERKTKEKQYQLIQMAGKLLQDDDSRKMYDLEQTTIKNSDFSSQRNSFEEFIKLQELNINDDTKKRAQIDFKIEAEKLNKARGFDPSKMDDKLDKETLAKEIDDLRVRRDIENIELTQKNLFEGRTFNPSEFNKMFDQNKKKVDKKQKKKNDEMVRFGEEFTAFNDIGVANYTDINNDYGDLFDNKIKDNSLYGNLHTGISDESSEEVSDDENYIDTYHKHNSDRGSGRLDDLLQQRMNERSVFDKKLEKVDTAEFKDVMEDQFGISRHFGKILGKETFTSKPTEKLDYDMVKVYNKMIKYYSDEE